MITTKEQERTALAKIRKIVDELGDDSYVAAALEGCIVMAAQNIDNDWMSSPMQKLADATKELAKSEIVNKELLARNEFLTKELDELSAKVISKANARITVLKNKIAELEEQVLPVETLRLMKDMLNAKYDETEIKLHEAVNDVIRLADNPDTDEFRAAVRRQRSGAEILDMLEKNCEIVSERLFRLGLS